LIVKALGMIFLNLTFFQIVKRYKLPAI
jgi:hypothetical protein